MRELGFSVWRRTLLQLSNVPLKTCIALAALQAATMFVALKWGVPIADVPIDGTVPDRIKDLLNHLTLVMTVQATVAALTFPMGIALITFLFGAKDSGGGRRHIIYLADSCAVVVGTSSMTLVLAMLLEDRYFWDADLMHLEWILSLDYGWCAINLLGTIYFLVRSFAFVDPASRTQIIRRYMLSVSWPSQAHVMYKAFSVIAASVDKELLPSGRDISSFGGLWSQTGDSVAVSKMLSNKRYLADVNFRLLDWGIRLWKAKLGYQTRKKSNGYQKNPKLIFPMDFNRPYKGRVDLCKVIGPVQPDLLSRALIWTSFRFTKSNPEVTPYVIDEILDELQTEALDLLSMRRRIRFEDKCDEIIDFLGELLLVSEYVSDDGQKGNFALLPRETVLGQRIYSKWFRIIFQLADAVAETIKDSPDYFHYLCYLPRRLLRSTSDLSQRDFGRETIMLSFSIFRRLELWWTRTAEEQGAVDHGICKPEALRPPYHSIHAQLLTDFTGAFEGMRDQVLDDPDDMSLDDWSRMQLHTELFGVHLQQVALMVSYAVNLGDRRGAEAAADMLQRWSSRLHLRHGRAYFPPHRAFRYTLYDVTNRTVVDFRQLAAVADELEEYDKDRTSVFVANVLENAWTDVQCVAIYALLEWALSCECNSSLPADIVRSLIDGTAMMPTAGSQAGPLRGVSTRGELLQAILRQQQRFVGINEGSYNGSLDGLFDEMHGVNESRLVPGRMYSGFGSRDLDSAMETQLVWLMILPSPWNPAQELREYVTSLAADDNEFLRELQRRFATMRTRLLSADFDKFAKVFLCIKRTDEHGQFLAARYQVRDGLDALITLVEQALNTAVADAPIYEGRKLEIAGYASRSAFSQRTAPAPLTFFRSVTYSRDVAHKYAFTINEMDRGEFVAPLRAQLAGNEQEWFDDTVNGAVAVSIMKEVIRKTTFQAVDASTPQAYWEEFKRLSALIRGKGLTPMLLIENRVVPKWTWDWGLMPRFGDAWVPEDLRVSRDESRDDKRGYEVTFNDVPLYQVPLPTGASVLLPEEYFKSITFREYEDRRCVHVDVASIPDKPTKVNMILSWGHDVEFDSELEGLVTKLMYGEKVAEE